MTRRTIILCSALLALGASAGLYHYLSSRHSDEVGMRGRVHPPEPQATEDNPHAREEFERMQLRDPGTGVIPRDIRRAELRHARTLPRRGSSDFAKRSADYQWIQRGPVNVGGRTRALAIDATNDRILLAGGVTGGMWRSTDRGATWRMTTELSQLLSVTCVAQDTRPGKSDTWYYGTGEFRTNSGRFGNTSLYGDGIFKSTDGGRSWRQLPSTVSNTPHKADQPFDFVNTIVVDRSNAAEDEVYAAVYGGIARSTDGGASWRMVLGSETNAVGYTTIAITATGVLYAGIGSGGAVEGIWRSEDGVSWSNISPFPWVDSCRRVVLAISPANENFLYVLAETPGRGMKVTGSYGFDEFYSLWKYTYETGDGSGAGGRWSDRWFNLPQIEDIWFYNGLNSYTMSLALDPRFPDMLYLGGTNLFRSPSGFAVAQDAEWLGGYGRNGNYMQPGELHPDQHTILIDPKHPDTILIGNDGGVYTTFKPDGETTYWRSLSNGYLTTQFYTVAIDHETPGSKLVLGGLQDNGTFATMSDDPAKPWDLRMRGDGSFCAVGDESVHYLSSQNAYILRVRLNDQGWPLEYVRVDPRSAYNFLFINPFALDPNATNIMYLPAGNELWRNSNLLEIPFDPAYEASDVNWERFSEVVTAGSFISAIAVSTKDPRHRLYYGTSEGRVYRIDDAHIGDPAPIDITGPGFPAGAYVNCIAVDPEDGERALMVFTNYNVQSLFSTTDGGASWSAVGGNLEENRDGTGSGPSCRWGAITHRGGMTYYFVATTTGLYSTTTIDGMETIWRQEGAETIGNVRVDMIAARSSDGMVAVATWGRGMFTTTLPLAEAPQSAEAIGFRLDESRPNPVRSMATIRIAVPEGVAGKVVRLSMLDAVGNEVGEISRATFAPGEHDVRIDLGRDDLARLPSGLYFYRLQCGDMVMTRRMMIAR